MVVEGSDPMPRPRFAHVLLLLAPAFFEAGRYTRDDVHYAGDTPVGETEFARDATFGYRSSNLRDFLREKVGDLVRNNLSERQAPTMLDKQDTSIPRSPSAMKNTR